MTDDHQHSLLCVEREEIDNGRNGSGYSAFMGKPYCNITDEYLTKEEIKELNEYQEAIFYE